MKEATGELSGSVVIVVSVGILIAFFYYVIWPKLDGNFKNQTACSKAVCSSASSNIDTRKGVYKTCTYKGGTIHNCKYKG